MVLVFDAFNALLGEVLPGAVICLGALLACGGLGVLLEGCGHSRPGVLLDLVVGGLLVVFGLGLIALIVCLLG